LSQYQPTCVSKDAGEEKNKGSTSQLTSHVFVAQDSSDRKKGGKKHTSFPLEEIKHNKEK